MTDYSISRRGALSAMAVLGLTGCTAAAAKPDWPTPTQLPTPTTTPTSTDLPTATPTVDPTATATPTGTDPTPLAAPPTTLGLIGMSAHARDWAQRVSEVGPGLAARRIFADLGRGPTHQLKVVEQAHADGMLPVISYKVGGDVVGATAGRFNAVAEQAAARLDAFGLPTAVTFWHEPRGDMAPWQYVAASQQLLPIFRRGQLRTGPILNGWLLDNQLAAFGSWCPDEMFGYWDWFGIDTYESGTLAAPGPRKPGQRITALSAYLRSRGHDLPLGVGEYNGYTAQAIADAGEALLSTPNVWFGCLWNVTGGLGYVLTGDRLAAFQRTLADPRSADPLT